MIPLLPQKIDHIGIAVHSIEQALPLYKDIWGLKYLGEEHVESEGVRVAFLQVGASKIELLEPLNPESPVARFLEKRGEGMHHMAFRVDDIQSRLHQLQQAGIQLIHERPKIGAGGNWVAFLHPRSTGGVLVELCEPRSKGMEA